MARIGSFDESLRPEGWFDETGVVEGWVDDDLIGATASGATATDFTPATGAATTSTMAGASTAATAFSQADGVATAGTLAGSSIAAADFVSAAGAATASTMVGDAISGGTAADFVAAAGVASSSTMAGSSIAAAGMVPADSVATASSMVGADADAPAPDVSVGGRRRKAKTRIERIKEFDVPLPPEVRTGTVPQDNPATKVEAAPIRPAKPKVSRLAQPPKKATPKPPKLALVSAAPAPVVDPESPKPTALQMLLQHSQTLTTSEIEAAIDALSKMRADRMPKLIRSARLPLIRGQG